MLGELFNRSTYDTSVVNHITLYDSLRKILITKTRIGAFMIWSDSAIEIYLPEGYVDKTTQASVSHLLRYKRVLDTSRDPYTKDTTVARGWTYEIRVSEYEERD